MSSVKTNSWQRKYFPYLTIPLLFFLAVVVLPSSLKSPQSNPTETTEYAPVTGGEDGPPNGNVSSFGLGSGGLSGIGSGDEPPDPIRSGTALGKNPGTKRCVGTPPKQTEDPMSPPCVAFFQGNNGGRTHTGVTGEEITVLIAGGAGGSTGYCDFDKPKDTDPGCDPYKSGADAEMISITKILAGYFNDRFQTYNRHVHFWWYEGRAPISAESRRADAADNFREKRPFAVIDLVGGYGEEYADAMAKLGVVVIPTNSFEPSKPGSYFAKYAPLIWSFRPDIEHWAEGYVSYVCTKIKGQPVAHAVGGVANNGLPMNGQQRRYALMYADDPRFPSLKVFAGVVREGVKKCGINLLTEVKTPTAHNQTGGYRGEPPEYAVQNIALLRQNDVTTVLWAGGLESNQGHVADSSKYYPELVIAGDGAIESNNAAFMQNQNWFRNAWAVTTQLRERPAMESSGGQACTDQQPTAGVGACRYVIIFYRDFFTLFSLIQTAGPRLTPANIDKGMHAISRYSSNNPFEAACFYDPGDYSCVKDSAEEWWDYAGPGERYSIYTNGCWRMPQEGKRYLAGTWDAVDRVFPPGRNDPCNYYFNTLLEVYPRQR